MNCNRKLKNTLPPKCALTYRGFKHFYKIFSTPLVPFSWHWPDSARVQSLSADTSEHCVGEFEPADKLSNSLPSSCCSLGSSGWDRKPFKATQPGIMGTLKMHGNISNLCDYPSHSSGCNSSLALTESPLLPLLSTPRGNPPSPGWADSPLQDERSRCGSGPLWSC